jgi:4-diphosphocytidyl-2-C-methyl-D-erythritol kinase
MILFPKAKINLGLSITGKRPDGFHNIETIFYPVNICDALEFVESDNTEKTDILTVTGIETGSSTDDNLVMKSVKLLREKHLFPSLKIHLHKVIPAGAGLGGGSSDASFMLKSLNRHYGLDISSEELRSMALGLGSDCPFFLDCEPSFASGRGEILKPLALDLSKYYLVLLNPGIGVNTREAYQNCSPATPLFDLYNIEKVSINEWKNVVFNDFEGYVFRKHPVIGQLKEGLYQAGALFSSMSGSGSSVFGIFAKEPALPGKLQDYLIWEGPM